MSGDCGRLVGLVGGIAVVAVCANAVPDAAAAPAAAADFRKSLRSMNLSCVASDVGCRGWCSQLPVGGACDQGRGVGGPETVIYINDGDVWGAGVEHPQ